VEFDERPKGDDGVPASSAVRKNPKKDEKVRKLKRKKTEDKHRLSEIISHLVDVFFCFFLLSFLTFSSFFGFFLTADEAGTSSPFLYSLVVPNCRLVKEENKQNRHRLRSKLSWNYKSYLQRQSSESQDSAE